MSRDRGSGFRRIPSPSPASVVASPRATTAGIQHAHQQTLPQDPATALALVTQMLTTHAAVTLETCVAILVGAGYSTAEASAEVERISLGGDPAP